MGDETEWESSVNFPGYEGKKGHAPGFTRLVRESADLVLLTGDTLNTAERRDPAETHGSGKGSPLQGRAGIAGTQPGSWHLPQHLLQGTLLNG